VPLSGALIQAAPDPVTVAETSVLLPANTTAANGTPVAGVVFVAPPSGKVEVTYHFDFDKLTAAAIFIGVRIRAGVTIGSGTLVDGGETGDGPNASRARLISLSGRIAAGSGFVTTGLTPGTSYNACSYHYVTTGAGRIEFRGITVKAIL